MQRIVGGKLRTWWKSVTAVVLFITKWAERFPLMQSNYMIAMNQTYANSSDLIEDPNVELALIPPVSGG
jgi:molybdopterin converting factor small subunit